MKKPFRTIKISLPEREPGEDDITPNQLAYIKKLAPAADMQPIKALGKWQASHLIDELKSQNELYDDELLEKDTNLKRRGYLIAFCLLAMFGLLILLLINI